MGDYGEFTVNLSDEEIGIIDSIINEETKGYKRNTLKERYPDLHQKIVDSASGLARDVLVHEGVTFLDKPLPNRVIGLLKKMSYHEQADYLASKYDLEPECIDADVCYYLCKEELPEDYDG